MGSIMVEKIPQHSHCAQCGKAYIGEGRFCSEECSGSHGVNMKKRKRQLMLLYAVSLVVLVIAIIALQFQ
jgi:predicted nucleic acid-binding Zn ribbon protein